MLGWAGKVNPAFRPSCRALTWVRRHADKEDLTALALEHGEAHLLILQKPVGGCDVQDHDDIHVPTHEAGGGGRQVSWGSLPLWPLSLSSLCSQSQQL